jgi:hypothetical protein
VRRWRSSLGNRRGWRRCRFGHRRRGRRRSRLQRIFRRGSGWRWRRSLGNRRRGWWRSSFGRRRRCRHRFRWRRRLGFGNRWGWWRWRLGLGNRRGWWRWRLCLGDRRRRWGCCFGHRRRRWRSSFGRRRRWRRRFSWLRLGLGNRWGWWRWRLCLGDRRRCRRRFRRRWLGLGNRRGRWRFRFGYRRGLRRVFRFDRRDGSDDDAGRQAHLSGIDEPDAVDVSDCLHRPADRLGARRLAAQHGVPAVDLDIGPSDAGASQRRCRIAGQARRHPRRGVESCSAKMQRQRDQTPPPPARGATHF